MFNTINNSLIGTQDDLPHMEGLRAAMAEATGYCNPLDNPADVIMEYIEARDKFTASLPPQPLTKDEEAIMDGLDILSEYIMEDEDTPDNGCHGEQARILGLLRVKHDAYQKYLEKGNPHG